MSIASLNRHLRGIELTDEDHAAFFDIGMGYDAEYAYGVADRNDAAVMLARSSLAAKGCRATRDRVMPA